MPRPPSTPEPTFTLSRPHGTVRGYGAAAGFTDAGAAATALRRGAVSAITGALPFDSRPNDSTDGSALIAPQRLEFTDSAVSGAPSTAIRTTTHLRTTPSTADHRDRVTHAVKQLIDGDLQKVVLARRIDFTVTPTVTVSELIAAFAAGNTDHNAFAVDVGAVDGSDRWLVGASPEVLLRKQGRVVTCHPFAGSAPRYSDPAADEAAAQSLLASTKDRDEHAFVVDYLRERLAPLSTRLDIPPQPQLSATGEVWHLATPIRAELRDDSLTALDLAHMLSPTPAVGGTPSDAALEYIRQVENDRGLYAGAIGWCDARGDGEWMVSIRCLLLGADGAQVTAWAGGGIVAASDPDLEVAEVDAKLRTVLRALGIDTLA